MKILDSGKRQKFVTGAVRDTREGKGRFDLLPPAAMTLLAKHFENGAIKYGDNNWLAGIPLSRYMDSALRHIFKVLADQQDEPHAEAAAWNLVAFLETRERIKAGVLPADLDDMPRVKQAK
jgi:hypothetical protein